MPAPLTEEELLEGADEDNNLQVDESLLEDAPTLRDESGAPQQKGEEGEGSENEEMDTADTEGDEEMEEEEPSGREREVDLEGERELFQDCTGSGEDEVDERMDGGRGGRVRGLREEKEEDGESGGQPGEDDNDGDDEEDNEASAPRRSARVRQRRGSPPRRSGDFAYDEDEEEEDEEEEESEEGGEEGGEDDEGTKEAEHAALTQQDGHIRVGGEYQAQIGPDRSDEERANEEEREAVMWKPPGGAGLDENDLMIFCEEAMGIYQLSFDRALYLLLKSDYSYEKALQLISSRRIITEQWCEDDALLFRQAFHLYGKNFARIRQTMPHRSMASIINHYYNTKKAQDYKSLVENRDRAAEKADRERERDYRRDRERSKSLDDDWEQGACDNCGEQVDRLYAANGIHQCNTCMLYYKLMLKNRQVRSVVVEENRKRMKIPGDLMDLVNEFVELAEAGSVASAEPKYKRPRLEDTTNDIHMGVCVFQSPDTKCHRMLRCIDAEMQQCRTRCVHVESRIRQLRRELVEKHNEESSAIQHLINRLGGGEGSTAGASRAMRGGEREDDGSGSNNNNNNNNLRGNRQPRDRIQYTWTENEKITAFHCFVRYGRDYDAVAEVVGTKSADMVKSFYQELRPDIDQLIEERMAASAEAAAMYDTSKLVQLAEKRGEEVVTLDSP